MDACSQGVDAASNYCPRCGSEAPIEALLMLNNPLCPQCNRILWFVRKSINDVVVVTFLPGRMFGSESDVRAEEVFSALGNTVRVVVNVSYLQSVASLFLTTLLGFRRKLTSVGGTLKLCGLAPLVAEVVRLTQFDKLFEIYPDEQAALRSF